MDANNKMLTRLDPAQANAQSRTSAVGTSQNGRASAAMTRQTSLPMQKETPSKKAVVPEKWWFRCSRVIVENAVFTGLTTLLTLWALTSDDIRVLATEKPSDDLFNSMVLVCLAVFTFEIMVSVLGKVDYWLGFFFALDVISTGTLILDLTYVQEAMSSSEESSGGGDLRSGRTARVGAKAARVIRVLRLVRILKLYKAYYEERQNKLRKQREAAEGKSPGDDDWDDEEAPEDQVPEAQESTLGKKLSEMTTRKLIMLILALLIVLPLLTMDQIYTPYATEYGVNSVLHNFQDYMGDQGDSEKYLSYQNSLLTFAYYHNWYPYHYSKYCPYDNDNPCSRGFWGHLYFIGVQGKNSTRVSEMAKIGKLNLNVIQQFNTESEDTEPSLLNFGIMPPQAQELMSREWNTNCKTGTNLQGVSLISDPIGGEVAFPVSCPEELRLADSMAITPQFLPQGSYQEATLVFYFDMRPYNHETAFLGLLTTGFVMILLLAGSAFFGYDANRLVIHPVEAMIKRVRAIRDDPLVATKMADDEFKAEEIRKAKSKRAMSSVAGSATSWLCDFLMCKVCGKGNEEGPMETVILEKTIIKLGSLLALGFGEAGANIIAHNMKGSDSAGVNAMVPGTQIDCIIGVCRVLDFSTATEVLQSKIMTFVNQIAEIIHGVVDEFHGAPNKNSGENFLVIWRLDPDGTQDHVIRLAEMSVVAFAKILGALHRSALLADYRTHPGLQYRLGKGSRVNLSFGVHAGWAIEGAVGSEFKIDASYVSPNVSIAASVERCSQVYGVSLVVAQSVISMCTLELTSKCRLIDRVIITGSAKAMDIYCVDLDWSSITVDESAPPDIVWNTRNQFKARQFNSAQKEIKWSQAFRPVDAFDHDPQIQIMRQPYTTQFFQLFNMGYQNYFQGEWQVARRMLSETRILLGAEDGPSSALLRYMEVPHQYEAPRDWHGVREMNLFF
mmetsp:Transcript_104128/g.184910  ORF Transcript_104128/g.184910 Transcript_104128/m.184910 type:complete len:954 (+) Transcript_104128:67-2928(+)